MLSYNYEKSDSLHHIIVNSGYFHIEWPIYHKTVFIKTNTIISLEFILVLCYYKFHKLSTLSLHSTRPLLLANSPHVCSRRAINTSTRNANKSSLCKIVLPSFRRYVSLVMWELVLGRGFMYTVSGDEAFYILLCRCLATLQFPKLTK